LHCFREDPKNPFSGHSTHTVMLRKCFMLLQDSAAVIFKILNERFPYFLD